MCFHYFWTLLCCCYRYLCIIVADCAVNLFYTCATRVLFSIHTIATLFEHVHALNNASDRSLLSAICVGGGGMSTTNHSQMMNVKIKKSFIHRGGFDLNYNINIFGLNDVAYIIFRVRTWRMQSYKPDFPNIKDVFGTWTP